MKRLGGSLAFVAVFLCSLCVYANGTFRGNGLFYAPGGGGGGVSPSSDLSLNVGSKLIFDADADANNYIVGADTILDFYIEAGVALRLAETSILYKDLRVTTDKQIKFGSADNTWLEWDTATTPDQLSLNNTDCDGGGTNCVIWYTEVGSPNLFLKNGEFIQNETDGSITFGESGGATDSKTITFQLDGTNGLFGIDTSETSIYFFDFVQSANAFTSGSTRGFYIDTKFLLRSDSNGQAKWTNYAGTTGFVMDFDDAADTMVIKNLAGTGDGNLNVTGGRNIGTRIIDVDDTPYTAVATDEVIIVDTDSGTGAPAAVTVNLPAAACGITIGGTEKSSCRILRVKNIGGTANVTVDANGAEEIDAATTQTVTPGGNLTLVDANQTNYHWVIQ